MSAENVVTGARLVPGMTVRRLGLKEWATVARTRARLAGTAKLRDDDPRKIAAQVAFSEAKAALNGGAR